jgi:hypothetical protein
MYEFIKVLDSLEDNNFEINYQKGGLTASQVQLGVPRRGRG